MGLGVVGLGVEALGLAPVVADEVVSGSKEDGNGVETEGTREGGEEIVCVGTGVNSGPSSSRRAVLIERPLGLVGLGVGMKRKKSCVTGERGETVEKRVENVVDTATTG